MMQDGTLTRHLKKAAAKGTNHQIPGVDFIYMINLDRRPDKYALASRHLQVYGIEPYRFSAVNGWELSKDAIQDVGVRYQPGMTPLLATRYPTEVDVTIQSHEFMSEYGRTYFAHCMPLGAIGCSLSHVSVLQDAWDSGYRTIWVMEDDVEVLSDPHRLSALIAELDSVAGADGWDVLFTDVDYRTGAGQYLPAHGAAKRPDIDCSQAARFSGRYTEVFRVNDHFRKIAARFGTASMVIRRSGIRKLLDFFTTRHIYQPYDLENHLPEGIRRFGLTFDLVTNMLHSISDIGVQAATFGTATAESFVQKYPEPVYQDLVVNGQVYRVGTDHCDSRYELIKPILDLYDGPFSVLDVGAAQGYFAFRIAQDYPHGACVMAESDATSYYAHHGSMLNDLCRMNHPHANLVYLNARLDASDLDYLGGAEHFDVVLALLVVHLMDDSLRGQIAILNRLLDIGTHTIVEVANDVGVLCTAYVEYLSQSMNARCLGEVRRHKDPKSAATGRLFWFTRAGDRSAVKRSDRSWPIQQATFTRLNGVYPADVPAFADVTP